MNRAELSSKINISESQKRGGIHPGHVTSPATDKHTIKTVSKRQFRGWNQCSADRTWCEKTRAGIKPTTLWWWTQPFLNKYSTRWWLNTSVHLCVPCVVGLNLLSMSFQPELTDIIPAALPGCSLQWLRFLTTSSLPRICIFVCFAEGGEKNEYNPAWSDEK